MSLSSCANRKWNNLKCIIERSGPFHRSEFEPSDELLSMVKEHVKILVIGAGGLGCELLKNLAMMGFCYLEVIDMDTIDISNLNRQFLFRSHDVGKPKANVAADFIMRRVPTCKVIPHHKRIQDFDASFYQQFNAVVCGLDSLTARRWINSMLVNSVMIDGDSPEHIQWIYEKSCERAKQFGISGVTLRLVQGVVKRIIPAVASTNAVIAAACATEVFKLITFCYNYLNNYMNFSDIDGAYTYGFSVERKPDCLACNNVPRTLTFHGTCALKEVIEYLKTNPEFQMQSPSITTIIEDQHRTLYIDLPELVDTLKPNLSKSLKVDPKEGDAYPVGALPVGTVISEFEIKPDQGALFCRTAGSSATVFRRGKYVGSKLNKESNSTSSNVELENEYVFVRTNGKCKICRLMLTCMSVVGQVSNGRDDQFKFRKFGEKKWRIKRRSGLWQRKTGRFGRKIQPIGSPIDLASHKNSENYFEVKCSYPSRSEYIMHKEQDMHEALCAQNIQRSQPVPGRYNALPDKMRGYRWCSWLSVR
ncbi:NEDD8-activating enzyme E1 catalytic subunit [Schistosoma japonicum]|nr:NEDD8-activating enzyme E1 catalytic subunit [Schistosoma japonicum]